MQDWGGPIGFWVANHRPEWFRAFVVGNTWAWPVRGDRNLEWFSKVMGSSTGLGGLLVKRADAFVNLFMRGGIKRRKLTPAEWRMYKRPHLAPGPGAHHAREILAAHEFPAKVEQGRGGSLTSRP